MNVHTPQSSNAPKPIIRLLCAFIAAALLAACGPADNQANNAAGDVAALAEAGLVEGTHYKLIKKPLATSAGKISAREFFWYGCPHCEVFEPTLHAWIKTLPRNVEFEQIPAVWAKPMELHGKAFYIAENQPEKAELHAALFKKIIALRSEKDMQVHEQQLAAVFAAHGLGEEAFLQQLDDDAIEESLATAMATMKQAEIQSTPTLMINGRYLVLNKTAQKAEDITAIADKLIAIERKRLRAGQ